MNTHLTDTAKRLLRASFEDLPSHEQHVIKRLFERLHISRDINTEFEERLTFGQRMADRVAAFGGSWTFIILFVSVLVAWVVLNTFILAHRGREFDPFPYILLNLVLSMIAALQAPVIMMSQNRQAAKDRLDATHDYQVNLKAEFEILSLHEKLDALRDHQWSELIQIQQQQIDLLTRLLEEARSGQSETRN
jgi:uncharacterized membrane protein